jgi:hypothetical protein
LVGPTNAYLPAAELLANGVRFPLGVSWAPLITSYIKCLRSFCLVNPSAT